MSNAGDSDVLIIGAGIAGASLATYLAGTNADKRRVTILERETSASYHTTGRSAAFWHETYGGHLVRPLTLASRAFLESPPREFSDSGFLSPRSAITIAQETEKAQLENFISDYRAVGVAMQRVGAEALTTHIAGLRPQWILGAYEAACSDIDVARLHATFLKQAQRAGAKLLLNHRFQQARWNNRQWQVETNRGTFTAHTLVNAAGAWADAVAAQSGVRPLGIRPLRRTVVQLRLGIETALQLPLILHVGGDFYFKGTGTGRIWLSPQDETPSTPCDAVPQEWDVALAIARFESVVDWPITAVEHKWAGLRSFAEDRLPVFGRDPRCPEFVWCAGQGGFGIQTAPAIGALLARQLGVQSGAATDAGGDAGYDSIDTALYAPSRFGGGGFARGGRGRQCNQPFIS